jgi:hypothetical protein
MRVLRDGHQQIRRIDQDKEALLEGYAALTSVDLDDAERNRIYMMPRVEAEITPDGSLEISRDDISVCEMEPLSL